MFDNSIYFPILKSKQGEFKALGRLAQGIQSRIAPTIDVVPNTSTVRTFGEHLDKICESAARHWSGDRPIIFDLFDIHLDQRTEANEHPVRHLFRSAIEQEINAIPCCGLDRDDEYLEAVIQVLGDIEPHLVIRLQREDLQAPTIAIPELNSLLTKLGLSPIEISIALDFRELQEPIQPLSQQAQSIVEKLRQIGDWNCLFFAGSAMPKSVAADIAQSSQGHVSRLEEELWRDLSANSALPISFGDYTVVNPEYVDLDPRIYANTMGPSVRYTTMGSWLIARGSSFSNHPDGYGQYYSLARTIESSDEFKGRDFSFGDEYICDRADESAGTGNPGTWLSAGINHHITFLVDQLLAD